MAGKKYDQGKIDYSLLPEEPIEALVKVLMYGAKKYGRDTWQTLDDFNNRYYSALRRHLSAWRKGELLDSESQLPHLHHAFCNMMFLVFNANGKSKGKYNIPRKDISYADCFNLSEEMIDNPSWKKVLKNVRNKLGYTPDYGGTANLDEILGEKPVRYTYKKTRHKK